jgi:uncharacterized membrane protein YjjP (DUF1212 family)
MSLGRPTPASAPVEDVAHLALDVGRLLFRNGADTAEVQAAVTRFAAAFGTDVRLLVTYEALLLTAVADGQFRTKIGLRVPSFNVNLAVVAAVNSLVGAVQAGRRRLADAGAEVADAEGQPPTRSRWVVVVALGLTAASLSRLFGGDWPAFLVAWLAGAAGTWLRQELDLREINLIAAAFAGALLSGLVGGLALLAWPSSTPALALVAPGMIIVPGVPLINGILDIIKNHVTVGIARLGLGALVTLAIAFGLFVATIVTGSTIAAVGPGRFVSVPEDALFSALAALGYAFLFNAPGSIRWACVLCGVAGHATRTFATHLGIDFLSGTLIAGLLVGALAQVLARHFGVPAVVFAFPGVVAMVPGAVAFQVVIDGVEIARGASAGPALVLQTVTLAITCMFVLFAIAVGIAAPLAVSVLRGSAGTAGRPRQ